MPRAPKQCSKCGVKMPCPNHKVGWAAKKPGTEMPSDWTAIRRRVWGRDNGLCVLCKKPGSSVDHVVPRSQGGSHDPSNLRVLCTPCHDAKSNIEKNWSRKRR